MKWEYKRIVLPCYRDSYDEEELNQYGDEGWELVCVYTEQTHFIDTYVYVFKRVKGEEEDDKYSVRVTAC